MKSAINSRLKLYFLKKGIVGGENRLNYLKRLQKRSDLYLWSKHFPTSSIDESITILEREIMEKELLGGYTE